MHAFTMCGAVEHDTARKQYCSGRSAVEVGNPTHPLHRSARVAYPPGAGAGLQPEALRSLCFFLRSMNIICQTCAIYGRRSCMEHEPFRRKWSAFRNILEYKRNLGRISSLLVCDDIQSYQERVASKILKTKGVVWCAAARRRSKG